VKAVKGKMADGALVIGDRGHQQGSFHRKSRMAAMKQPTPVVYVVDDDVSIRESLELLFLKVGWRSETFGSASAFLSRSRNVCLGCLVLDVCLPDIDGLELQKLVAADRLAMPVIFITAYCDVRTTVRAMKAGAIEVLVKPLDEESLLDAVREAITRSMDTLDREESLRTLRECYASLSPREREVMALVTAGLLNKQAGAELGISEITVKAHRGNVMRKMQASSLADLVKMSAKLRDTPALNNRWRDSNMSVSFFGEDPPREAAP
jgi:FixJ family two-component response regulator